MMIRGRRETGDDKFKESYDKGKKVDDKKEENDYKEETI